LARSSSAIRAINPASSAEGSRKVKDSNIYSTVHEPADECCLRHDLSELDPGGLAPLAFGYGAIACLGAAPARLQATVGLRRFLARKPVLAAP
jgi:hypothetical protein